MKERADLLHALGLKYNGEEYYLDDFNVHWTEITCDTDEVFTSKCQRILGERFRRLHAQYDSGETDDLSLEDWRTLLAHELWADGMEWTDAVDVLEGKNEMYNERGSILVCLGQQFGYIKEDA